MGKIVSFNENAPRELVQFFSQLEEGHFDPPEGFQGFWVESSYLAIRMEKCFTLAIEHRNTMSIYDPNKLANKVDSLYSQVNSESLQKIRQLFFQIYLLSFYPKLSLNQISDYLKNNPIKFSVVLRFFEICNANFVKDLDFDRVMGFCRCFCELEEKSTACANKIWEIFAGENGCCDGNSFFYHLDNYYSTLNRNYQTPFDVTSRVFIFVWDYQKVSKNMRKEWTKFCFEISKKIYLPIRADTFLLDLFQRIPSTERVAVGTCIGESVRDWDGLIEVYSILKKRPNINILQIFSHMKQIIEADSSLRSHAPPLLNCLICLSDDHAKKFKAFLLKHYSGGHEDDRSLTAFNEFAEKFPNFIDLFFFIAMHKERNDSVHKVWSNRIYEFQKACQILGLVLPKSTNYSFKDHDYTFDPNNSVNLHAIRIVGLSDYPQIELTEFVKKLTNIHRLLSYNHLDFDSPDVSSISLEERWNTISHTSNCLKAFSSIRSGSDFLQVYSLIKDTEDSKREDVVNSLISLSQLRLPHKTLLQIGSTLRSIPTENIQKITELLVRLKSEVMAIGHTSMLIDEISKELDHDWVWIICELFKMNQTKKLEPTDISDYLEEVKTCDRSALQDRTPYLTRLQCSPALLPTLTKVDSYKLALIANNDGLKKNWLDCMNSPIGAKSLLEMIHYLPVDYVRKFLPALSQKLKEKKLFELFPLFLEKSKQMPENDGISIVDKVFINLSESQLRMLGANITKENINHFIQVAKRFPSDDFQSLMKDFKINNPVAFLAFCEMACELDPQKTLGLIGLMKEQNNFFSKMKITPQFIQFINELSKEHYLFFLKFTFSQLKEDHSTEQWNTLIASTDSLAPMIVVATKFHEISTHITLKTMSYFLTVSMTKLEQMIDVMIKLEFKSVSETLAGPIEKLIDFEHDELVARLEGSKAIYSKTQQDDFSLLENITLQLAAVKNDELEEVIEMGKEMAEKWRSHKLSFTIFCGYFKHFTNLEQSYRHKFTWCLSGLLQRKNKHTVIETVLTQLDSLTQDKDKIDYMAKNTIFNAI